MQPTTVTLIVDLELLYSLHLLMKELLLTLLMEKPIKENNYKKEGEKEESALYPLRSSG